jgi:hypothetical protein
LSFFVIFKYVKIIIYRTIILSRVLYGCEAWTPSLWGECRLRLFDNRVLRRMFGPVKEEVLGGWREPHIEKLHKVIESRVMRWVHM